MDRLLSILDKKLTITIRLSLWLMVFLLLILYASWEVYWFIKVNLAVVKWHTHLAPYIYLWFIVAFLYHIADQKNKVRFDRAFLLFSSVVMTLFALEAIFVISGIFDTYTEQISYAYHSPYRTENAPYHLWPPNEMHMLNKPEFSYPRQTNSLGFSDIEWPKSLKPNKKRILALGDSFTEGDGTPYDSSYVYLLQNILAASGDSSEVMNAGTCGSDPFNNYYSYKDLLLPYHPDMILQSMGSGDLLTDILIRGGMERFRKDGTVQYRQGPWWEPIYAISHISRIFFKAAGYNELLQKTDPTPADIQRLTEITQDLYDRYDSICTRNGVKLIVVLHPDKGEVERNHYNYDFSKLISHLQNVDHIKIIDLLPSYHQYMEHHHTTASTYYWKMDGHHNSNGYRMMAETTFQNLSALLQDSVYVSNN